MFQNIEQLTSEYAGKVKDAFVSDMSAMHVDFSNTIVSIQEQRQKVTAEAFDTIKNDEQALAARLSAIKNEAEAGLNGVIAQAEQKTAEAKAKLVNSFENIHTKYEEILRILKA